MEAKLNISIVTVGMNHLKYIKSLLNSLYGDGKPESSFEMIYIDNCSSDGSIDFIKEYYPSVRIIENTMPCGFGENNNKGAALANGKYIAIINPDIILEKNSLDNLYKYSENVKYDCIVVPKLLNLDRTLQYSVRGFITPWVFIMRFLTLGNDKTTNKTVENYLCKNINTDQIQFIDWAIGAALFLSTDLYKKLNGFDPSYFLYVEDVDLCLRSWDMGSPVIYYPKSEMIHNHLRASTKINKRTLNHIKSILIYFFKHGIFVGPKKSTSSLKLILEN